MPLVRAADAAMRCAAVQLLFNSCSYVFLLHILYTILLKRLGLQVATAAPAWVVKAGGPTATR